MEYHIIHCPHCGSRASPINNGVRVSVECDTCGARGPVFSMGGTNSTEKAVNAWNKRLCNDQENMRIRDIMRDQLKEANAKLAKIQKVLK